eukprot:1152919-Amphidinium_carterae.4
MHELDNGLPAAVHSKALWGAELVALPQSLMAEIREAILRLYNKGRQGGYNPDALLTVLATRPWLDPSHACAGRVLSFWFAWIRAATDEEFRFLQHAWDNSIAALHQGLRDRGLFARLWEALSHFNWRASSLHVWYTAEGVEMQLRTAVPGFFKHEVRRGAKLMACHQLSLRSRYTGLAPISQPEHDDICNMLAPALRHLLRYHQLGASVEWGTQCQRENRTPNCPKCGHAFVDWMHQIWDCDLHPALPADVAKFVRSPLVPQCLLTKRSQRQTFLARIFTLLQTRRQAYLDYVLTSAPVSAASSSEPHAQPKPAAKKKGQRSTATELHAKRTASIAAPASTSARAHVWVQEVSMANAHRWVCTTCQRHAYNRDRIKLDLMGCAGAPQKKGEKVQQTLATRKAWQLHLQQEESQTRDVEGQHHWLLAGKPERMGFGCRHCGRFLTTRQMSRAGKEECRGKPVKKDAKQIAAALQAHYLARDRPDQACVLDLDRPSDD